MVLPGSMLLSPRLRATASHPQTLFQQREPCVARDSQEHPLLNRSRCCSLPPTSPGCFSEQETGHGNGHQGITLSSNNHRELQPARTDPRVPPSLSTAPSAARPPNPATLQHSAAQAERQNSRTGNRSLAPDQNPPRAVTAGGALLCPASAALPREGCFTSSSLPSKINNEVDVKQKSGVSPKPLETAGT